MNEHNKNKLDMNEHNKNKLGMRQAQQKIT